MVLFTNFKEVYKRARLVNSISTKSIQRYKMLVSILEAYFISKGLRYPADWFGFAGLLSMPIVAGTAIAAERFITLENLSIINYKIVIFFLFITTLVAGFFKKRHISTDRYSTLKIFPISLKEIAFIKYINELTDYKIFILITYFIIIPLFNYIYDLSSSISILAFLYSLVTLTYILACSLLSIVNDYLVSKTKFPLLKTQLISALFFLLIIGFKDKIALVINMNLNMNNIIGYAIFVAIFTIITHLINLLQIKKDTLL